MSEGRVPFNVNHYVRVRLTTIGRQHLCDTAQDWRLRHGINVENGDGWSRWQLWDLMATFGAVLGNGMNVPFETMIEFEPEQCSHVHETLDFMRGGAACKACGRFRAIDASVWDNALL